MIFGSPYSLLLLLGAIPLILFLHSLRPKGPKLRTSALFIWERILKEKPVGKRLSWLLRNNVLLILQLLIAALLIMALADPLLLRLGAPPGDMIVVMDLSASMKARGHAGSRFDGAQKALDSLIDGITSDQKMMLIGAGPFPRILAPFTGDKRRLREVMRQLEPTDAPADVREAVLLGHSFLRRGSSDHVVVVSDGAFEGAGDLPWRSPHLRFVMVDGRSENIGIVAFEIRRLPARPSEHEILLGIKNFTSRPLRAPLSLNHGEQVLSALTVEIGAGETRRLIYPYRGPLSGRATATLHVDDDFKTDNRAFLALSESPTVRLLYVGKGNPFLERLFASLPNVQLSSIERMNAENLDSALSSHDVILLDGVPSPPLHEGNFLLINTVAQGLPLGLGGKIIRPRLLPSLAQHPLMEGVRLDDLYIKEALRLLPTGGVSLIRSREGPLIFAVERGRLRAMVLGFDLLSSDLPYRVAFPVLLSNALNWFFPERVEFPGHKIQAGSPYLLHLSPGNDTVEITTPSGQREILKVASIPYLFAETFEVGFYRFKSGAREGEFAVNLLNESESEVSPRIAPPPASRADAKSEGKGKSGFPLWRWLLMAAFFVLAVEVIFYLRAAAPSFYPLLFRGVVFTVLLVAMINPALLHPSSGLDVILGVDASLSVGAEGGTKAAQVLEEAGGVGGPDTRTGLLFFGRRPVWEFFPRADFPAADFSPAVEREETDIQSAIQAALSQLGEGRQGRILLISDGNENRGAALRLLPLLRSQGVSLWALPVGASKGQNEIYIRDLNLPRQVDSWESFEVRGAIESIATAPARVKLLRDGVIQGEEALQLKPGTNWIRFRQRLKDRGSHTFELLVESPEDALAENNILQGIVEVKGPPRVLYLHSRENEARFLSRALSAQGYAVVESSPELASLALPEIGAFDLLVLDNIPAYRLSQAKMENIETYVRDLGGGLVVIGGAQSYGAGGYYRTPLERLLPVDMRPPSRVDLPHVALLFVLDKSGSMAAGTQGATKLELAKAAALSAADLLHSTDQVGILAFDANWDWLLPFRQVGRGEWISEHLTSLNSDGGTDLYKAMVEAHRAFSSKSASIKHVLVLSDGLTDKMDFPTLVQRMARAGITVSTVSVGQDADRALMSDVARYGKGRAYVTVDPRSVPQIFTAETLLIARDILIEKSVYPRLLAPMGALRGFAPHGVPPIHGYVLTHAKAHAHVLMKAEEDPLLSEWRYGLGKVVSFTSDLTGRWGRDWVRWENFAQWAGQLARSAVRRSTEHRIKTELNQEGGEVRAILDAFSTEGGLVNYLRLSGTLTAPGNATFQRAFQQIAPGRYESRFPLAQKGIYFLTIAEAREKEEPLPALTVPFVVPYPREYRELKPDIAFLSRLVEETGGELLDPDEIDEGLKRLFTPDKRGHVASDIWWPISGLGLLFFLADLALRRIPRRES